MSILSTETMIDNKKMEELKKNYEHDPNNKIRRRFFNKVPMIDLITDDDTNINMNFNITVKSSCISDQQNSGRCWSFAELNKLKEKVVEKCNLSDFKLSGSYISFYDKIERYNKLLDRLIEYKKEGKDLYDRKIDMLLEDGQTDGGFYSDVTSLIEKYGIVPEDIYPESFQSSHTYEINLILSRLIRKFYIELQETKNEVKLKEAFLQDGYNVIANVYGIPPEKFDFEYTDKNNKYHIDKNITPKQFYDKYIGDNLKEDYVTIFSYSDNLFKYDKLYQFEATSKISGDPDNIRLNLEQKYMIDLILKQLKDNESVYFTCSTTSRRIEGIWTDTLEKYGELFGIDLSMNKNDIIKSNGITGAHAMIFIGANVVSGKPIRWKIENSWGTKYGKNGYYVATNDWVDKYVYSITINKKHLSKKQLALLNQEAIKIPIGKRKV